MNRRFWFCFIAIVFWIGNRGSLPAGPENSGVTLLLSADTRGELFRCRDCVADKQLGGLARRGTLVERERAEHPGLLLVDAGNALFGADSLESRGEIMLAAYNALTYDAVNLSYRDFRLGKAATVKLVKNDEVPFVSANLLDEESGNPIAAPYRIKKIQERKIALIGVTQSPAGLSFLPHLQEQLAGIRIEPPAQALAKWLPRARHDADRVILLYYGSAAGMEPIRAQFADRLDAILVGGSRPEYLPAKTVPPVVGTSERGRHLARIGLSGSGPNLTARVSQLPVSADIAPSDQVQNMLAQYRKAVEEPVVQPVVPEPPPKPVVAASGANEAVLIALSKFQFAEMVGTLQARAGKTFAILDTRWENIHPKQKVEKGGAAGRSDITRGVGALGWGGMRREREYVEADVPYRVERLADHVYLLADGLAFPLHRASGEISGGVSGRETFTLGKQGEAREMRLVFLIPERARHIAFRFMDYAYGHVVLPLRGDVGKASDVEAAGMVLAKGGTAAAEFIVRSVGFRNRHLGKPAPQGWHYAMVDLGGKSLLASADRGNILRISPADNIWASTEGGYLYYCEAVATAEEGMVRFPPELFQHQELACLVPSDVRAMDLGIRVQNDVAHLAMLPEGAGVLPEPLATHRDGNVLELVLYSVQEKNDRQVADLGIRSLKPRSGIEIQAGAQFVLRADGQYHHPDTEAIAALPHRPPEPFIVPPGAFIRFELAYATTSLPTGLRYRGFKSERLIPIGKVPPIILASAAVIRLSRGDPVGLSLEDTRRGVEINYVTPGSPAEQAGLQAGDWIVAVNGESGMNAADVMMAISAIRYAKREKVLLKTRRGNDSFQVTLSAK